MYCRLTHDKHKEESETNNEKRMKSFLNNIDGKNARLKKRIIALCMNEGNNSIADLSKELNTSIPTITKLVAELMDEGFLIDMGKLGTNGGRRPSIYGLNPSAGYLVGIDIRKEDVSVAVTDFKGQLVDYYGDMPVKVESTEASFRKLCAEIKDYLVKTGIDKDKILAYGVNLSGRVKRLMDS